eukprot:gene13964-40332_t
MPPARPILNSLVLLSTRVRGDEVISWDDVRDAAACDRAEIAAA